MDSAGNPYTNAKITLDGSGNIVIDKETVFATEEFWLRAVTPGGQSEAVQIKIMVTNQGGCTYSHSGETVIKEYFKFDAAYNYDFSTNACKYTSTNTAATECPLY